MFLKIAAFELRYQLKNPVFWVTAAIFFLLTFGSVVIDQIQIGSGGNVHKNSAYAIAQVHLVWTFFFMFVSTAFVANVVVRDDETGFGPIIRSTRVTKRDYLYGRFTGAFAAAALCFLSVPLGFVLGSVMPWIDPETLGPFRSDHYLFAYFALALPSLFLTSAIFFAVATAARSMMLTYVCVVALFIGYLAGSALLGKPELEDAAALWEPFGLAAFDLVTKYWTAAERNTLMPAPEGVLLWNRLIYLGVAAGCLAGAYLIYRPDARGVKASKKRELEDVAPPSAVPLQVGALPRPSFGRATAWRQLAARTQFDMAQVFRSPAFFMLLVLGVGNSVAALAYVNEMYGAEIFPVTRVMIETLFGAFSIVPIIVAIYYAGELVWRERAHKTHEIVDATPVPDWTFVVPKVLAIALVLVSTLVVGALSAIAMQAIKGYSNFELGKYIDWYVLPGAVDFGLFAVLAVFVQAISPHKFVGWGVMVLYIVAQLTFNKLGFEHHLYNYGGNPPVPLSDMNGQGDFGRYAAWFRAYWAAFAIVLTVLAYGLWRRGTETRLRPRFRRLPRRLMGPAGVIGGTALAAFVGLGVFIFYNTNVVNAYRTSIDDEEWQAQLEKDLLSYETLPQPTITEVTLEVDVHPHEPRVMTRGVYAIENRTGAPIAELHLRFDRDLRVDALVVDGARQQRTYDDYNYRILAFEAPMQPGQRRTLKFETTFLQRGFKNSGNTTRVVDNGTFISSGELTPELGMSRTGLLQDRATRRKYGLPPELRPTALSEAVADRRHTYLRKDSDWVTSDITVTTDADQVPIAPGTKVSEIVRGGRKTARFVTEAPILHFFSIQSADYAVERKPYKGVDLEIYYDRQHPYNVQRMIRALQAGLDYYEGNFSDYQFRQARIIEFPDYAQFAQAFAGTMPYSEGIGFIANFVDPEKIDYVTYVTAHELGHQWWAHQVMSADMQGGTILVETLAQYSALMVMEKLYGPDQIRRFLKYELDSYLRGRGSEVLEELPLYKVENQPYIHYRKGSLVMYLLKDTIGEDAVNRALRSVLTRYAFKAAPYPTSIDLVRALRAEAGEHQDLITDLFERITLYDVKTTGVEVKPSADGRFDVTMTVEARKLYADGKGVETEAPLNETFDVGLFTAEPGKGGFDSTHVILFEDRPIHSGTQTFTFIVDREPRFAGVDPYNKRIDRNSDDNILAVE